MTTLWTYIINERAAEYTAAIHASEAHLPSCVGFVDGNCIRCCRLERDSANQRRVYSSHKRVHCLSYLSVTKTNGIILFLFCPVEGRHPDSVLYVRSNLKDYLSANKIVNEQQ